MKLKISLKTISILIFPALVSCTKSEPVTPAPYKVEGNLITLREGTPFQKHLEIQKVQTVKNGEGLGTVGQMIALANPPGDLAHTGIAWTELDPDFSKILKLNLNSFGASVGTALGVTSLPAEYRGQVKVGETVEVSRYGLKKSSQKGVIVQINALKEKEDSFKVIFKLGQGQDWYPGTNCEVKYPLLFVKPVQVPTTAILHEGLQEYVIKRIAPLQFQMVGIIIVNESSDMAQVVGLKAEDSVVASGAILFKPELHNFIQDRKEGLHVLQ